MPPLSPSPPKLLPLLFPFSHPPPFPFPSPSASSTLCCRCYRGSALQTALGCAICNVASGCGHVACGEWRVDLCTRPGQGYRCKLHNLQGIYTIIALSLCIHCGNLQGSSTRIATSCIPFITYILYLAVYFQFPYIPN